VIDHEPGVRTLIWAARALCSWGRFHPGEDCLTAVDGPAGEAGPSGSLVNRYCPDHQAALWAILAEDVIAKRGAKGIRKTGETGPGDPEAKRRMGEALVYVTAYTGTWSLILDIRSDRRFGTAYMRLSDRQVEVILAARDRDAARAAEVEIASDLFHAGEYERSLIVVAPVSVAPVAPRSPVVADGMYRKDGTTYKVQTARESGKRYAKVLDEQARRFVYTPGAITRLSAEDRLTIEEAEAFGKLYGWCCVCGATLTDEKSIARGIGPVCGGRI
jgi:Family of unknown function (DUF6011)